MLRALVMALVCVAGLAGCAQVSGGSTNTSARVNGGIHAETPPSDYVIVSSAERGNVGTSFEPGELSLSLVFGMHFLASAEGAKPAHPGTVGAGTSVRDPIRLDPPVEARSELDTALGWVSGRFPDHSDLKGWLLRSPDSAGPRAYLLYVELQSAGAGDAVYIDVTRWAAANRQIGS